MSKILTRARLEELREIHVKCKWKELSDQAILELIDGALEMVDVAELDMRLTKTLQEQGEIGDEN